MRLTRSDGTGNLRLEILDRVQVGKVDPAIVGRQRVVAILLHVEHVQDDVHSIQALEQHNDLQRESDDGHAASLTQSFF